MNFRRIFAIGLIAVIGMASPDIHGSAKKAGFQAPGFYRITVGEVYVTVLSVGTVSLPMDQLLTHTTPALVDHSLTASFIKEPCVSCIVKRFGP